MTTRRHRYVVTYDHDPHDPACAGGKWACLAYDAEHAVEKFYGGLDSDGWCVLGVDRPRNGWGKVRTDNS